MVNPALILPLNAYGYWLECCVRKRAAILRMWFRDAIIPQSRFGTLRLYVKKNENHVIDFKY